MTLASPVVPVGQPHSVAGPVRHVLTDSPPPFLPPPRSRHSAESVDDVLLRHVGVPAPLQVGGGHRVGREEEAELPGQDETSDSFENLQTEWWRILQDVGLY